MFARSVLQQTLGDGRKNVLWVRPRVFSHLANTRGRTSMEISVIELVLRSAVQRGVLYEADVNAAVDRMWSAVATFKEAQRIPRETPQEREKKMAAAMEE